MKERPILFSGPMVRAILENRKTQTRRVIKTPRSWIKFYSGNAQMATQAFHRDCDIWNCGTANGNHWQDGDEWIGPNYQEADRLWVRETFAIHPDIGSTFIYRADRGGDYQGAAQGDFKWKPSIFMPRWASRLSLEITGVRVERLQGITEADAIAEGIKDDDCWRRIGVRFLKDPIWAYSNLWDSINGKKHPWKENCWVWVITFKRV